MIKFGIRRNLLYPITLFVCDFLRKIDIFVMEVYDLKYSLLFVLIMFLSEFVSGLSLFLYQKKNFINKNENEQVFMGIKLIKSTITNIPHPDSSLKIYILIFLISLLDFIEFLIQTYYCPIYLKELGLNSNDGLYTFNTHLTSILALTSFLLYWKIFKSKIYRHQKLSLYIIFICTIFIIVLDFFFEIFQYNNKITEIFIVFGLIFIEHFFYSIYEIIEKYLFEYNFMNPFQLLMIEGGFGCAIALIFILFFLIISNRSFKEIIFENFNEKNAFPLIVLLFIYFILCGARNTYKIVTNKIFSPMTLSLSYCILNPIMIIIYIIVNNIKVKEEDIIIIFYDIPHLVLSLIIVFFCCIYNELIILFCCNLERDTHYEIYKRADNDINMNYLLNDDDDIIEE